MIILTMSLLYILGFTDKSKEFLGEQSTYVDKIGIVIFAVILAGIDILVYNAIHIL